MIMKTSNSISNECPTQDNIIDCSECDFECKLRMATKLTYQERLLRKRNEELEKWKKIFHYDEYLKMVNKIPPEPYLPDLYY